METAALYTLFKSHPHISTDTRKIKPGGLFFALKGANFNGNHFAEAALQAGSAYAIIDDAAFKKNERYIVVENGLSALQELSRYHRAQLNIPVIGITGSNGKTTTKELLNVVLSQKYKVYATKGNLNNHIGVPLSLLEITDETEVAIIEMGANHLGEIAFLCGLAQPNYGLITNIGKAHLEGFGSLENIKKGKGELYTAIGDNQGMLFIQADNALLLSLAAPFEQAQLATYGFSDTNQVYGQVTEQNPFLRLQWSYKEQSYPLNTLLTGAYNLENILAAIRVGIHFGVAPEEINQAISSYQPNNSRSQLLKKESNSILCDYYNANASSMEAAIENFAGLAVHSEKVLILGDMLELGQDSGAEHKKIIHKAGSIGAARLIFVGPEFYAHRTCKPQAEFYLSTADTVQVLEKKPLRDSLILLKASRGMAFEQLLHLL